MEVFKKVPQMPHFSPLGALEEIAREISVINFMMRFSYEVERISAGSPDDLCSPGTVQYTFKSLKELESHGFSTIPLQLHLNKLCVKIEQEEELKGNLTEVESRICKCQDEKTELDILVIELGEQIKALQKQNSLKRLKDLELANLESQRDIMLRKVQDFQLTKNLPFEW